jgi:hypothetical protein
VFNAPAALTVPREPMPGERLSIYVQSVSLRANEMGRYLHVIGITVNKTIQTVESAADGAIIDSDNTTYPGLH